MVLLWFFRNCDRDNNRYARAINKVLEVIRNYKINGGN